MANGQVVTGYSKPVVAKYNFDELTGVVTYTNCQSLARGVDVNIDPSTSDASVFYADNVKAEETGKKFTGGDIKVTVDGLLRKAERFIQGLPEADGEGWLAYNNEMEAPALGFGFIMRVMSGGVTSYIPVVMAKTTFAPISTAAATQGEEIDWQTQELNATIMRDDTEEQNWKFVGDGQATEAAAFTKLCNKLGGLVSA